jgi:hypothetical protein
MRTWSIVVAIALVDAAGATSALAQRFAFERPFDVVRTGRGAADAGITGDSDVDVKTGSSNRHRSSASSPLAVAGLDSAVRSLTVI